MLAGRISYKPFWALAAVLVFAAALRIHGFYWDSGMVGYPHPDERHLANTMTHVSFPWPPDLKILLNPDISPLNPRRINPEASPRSHYDLAYGALPVHLYRATCAFLGRAFGFYLESYEGFYTVGRGITVVFALLTVWFVYLIGREVYGRAPGILAAAFLAFSVTHIQLSHFMTVDVILTAFAAACIYMGARFVREGRWKYALGMGLSLGMAAATKVSGAMLAVAAAIAWMLWAFHLTKDEGEKPGLVKALIFGLLIILGAGLGFCFFEFYVLLDPATYLEAVGNQDRMVRGLADWPYTRQYVNTTPYLYHINNLVRWGLGPALGLASMGGFLWATIHTIYALYRCLALPKVPSTSPARHDHVLAEPSVWGSALLLSWALPYFLYIGQLEVKFIRYMLPLVPFLCLFGAEGTLRLAGWAARLWGRPEHRGKIYKGAVFLALLPTIFYALAFSRIYTRPHTWLDASRWIYANIPPGSNLSHELWDDTLPVAIPKEGKSQALYPPHVRMDIYQDMPPVEKFRHLAEALRRVDYVVLTTPRLYGAVRRLPWRYPVEIRYYELLFSGQLGFELAYAATSYPGLWGLNLIDDEADESFSVYDHPKVLIYRKVRQLSDEELQALFEDVLHLQPIVSRRGDEPPAELPIPRHRPSLMLEAPVGSLPPTDDYAWNELASENHLIAAILWLVFLEIISLLALPLAGGLFHSFADRGHALSKVLGLLLLSYGAWMPVHLGLWPYTRAAVWLALLFIALLSAFSLRRSVLPWGKMPREALLSEGVFLAAFLFSLLLRLGNPDLWHPVRGGEKPMEFGFLNAILRSPHLPPHDPFFSGGCINYYYYGLFVVSTLVKATGIAPSVAFNLIIPTLFAMTVAGAWSVVYTLTGKRKYGLAAGVFVAAIGNLAPLFQERSISDVLASLRSLASPETPGPLRMVEGLGRWLTGATLPLPTDWFWAASRVHGLYEISITEFPFFSFLFADLHPHLINIPFVILVVALAFSLVKNDEERSLSLLPISISFPSLRLLIVMLALGGVAIVNSWDFPTCALLIGGGLALRFITEGAESRRARNHGNTEDTESPYTVLLLFGAGVGAGVLAIVGLGLYLPFFTYYEAFVKGLGRVRYPTEVQYYLAMFGLFLFILASYLVFRFGREKPGRGLLSLIILIPLLALAYGKLNVLQWLTFLLLGEILLFFLACMVRNDISPEERFMLLLGAAGLAVSLGVEVVYIRDHLDGGSAYRMNTIFKFYIQVWILLALASAAALRFITEGAESRRARNHGGGGIADDAESDECAEEPGSTPSQSKAYIWQATFAILLLGAIFYLPFGIYSRLRDRFPTPPPFGTLDGLAYMSSAHYQWEGQEIHLGPDLRAIRWLIRNIRGTPVLLQADHEFYRANGMRIAYNTGLPTVLGNLHENEQRYPEEVGKRHSDVEFIYNEADPEKVLPFLALYDVIYIYIGPFERAAYSQAGLEKFERMEGSHLDLVYNEEGVRIYRLREESKAAYRKELPSPSMEIPTLAPRPPMRYEEDELKLLEQAAQANPEDVGLQMQLGRRYREMGRYEDAIRVFRESLRRHPEDVAMYHMLGDIYKEMGQEKEALAQYKKAAEVAPQNPAAHNKLGMVYMEWGRPKEAEEAFRAAIKADPNFAEAYFHLGELLEIKGDLTGAGESYSLCESQGPGTVWAEGCRRKLEALGLTD